MTSLDVAPDTRDIQLAPEQGKLILAQTWSTPRGVWGALTTVDHKIIGLRYIITAFVFLAMGGVLAMLMRLQLATPEARVMSADLYNQVFTVHGSNMMFLFAVPVMEAMGVYLVPLMVGTRNIAFPRLNAFSYWIYLGGGILLWAALFLQMGPDVGWFAYVPLSGPQYGAGKRADMWAQMITFTEVSALAVAVEIVVTVFKQRAPGMSLNRIPLFVWSMLVTSFMVIGALPAIMVASTSLILDRLVGTHFFNPAEGGDVLLWQHLFWFFGHPEVYIIFLPAVGMVSTIIPTFSRRPMFGYLVLVLALVSTSILAFGLWVHHMFVTGLPRLGESFFTASSMAIATPKRHPDFLLARHTADGTADPEDATALRLCISDHLCNRRPDGRHGRVGAVRHASSRYLFRRGPLPLRVDRRRCVSTARGGHVLVSQDDRSNDEREARTVDGWPAFRRLQFDLLPDASPRSRGHASPRLYLST